MQPEKHFFGIFSFAVLVLTIVSAIVVFFLNSSGNPISREETFAVVLDALAAFAGALIVSVIGVSTSMLLAIIGLVRGENRLFPIISLCIGFVFFVLVVLLILMQSA